ncbi:MAG: phosphoadenylyl-sulfate reductase [Acidimicrobiales bacterium]
MLTSPIHHNPRERGLLPTPAPSPHGEPPSPHGEPPSPATRSPSERSALLDELAERSAGFESASARSVTAWALGRFGAEVSLACSFQDAVIVDLAVSIDPGIEVIFLDTGSHFPETLAFVERIRARHGLNLTIATPTAESDAWPCGSATCCDLRKVRPLERALSGQNACLTGLKRVDAPTRAAIPIVSYDERWDMVKINPLATWSDRDIASYETGHGIPRHPLLSQGYLSIGCAPTTRPVTAGEDRRAGRWSGSDKVECGLHR